MRIFGNVILDYESFKALSSRVRIDILKSLDKRQMTVTDLSRALKLSKSNAHKHLERLVNVGLIERVEDHRKWVYYRISRKGMKLMHPENVTVGFILSWSLLFLGVVLVSTALYLVWSPFSSFHIENDFIGISAVAGVLLVLSGGSLIFKNPIQTQIEESDNSEVEIWQ